MSEKMWVKVRANANLHVNLGVIVLGQSLNIDDPEIGMEFEISDQSKISENDFGNQFVDEFPSRASLGIKFAVLDYADAQAIENAYRQNGNRKPVLVTIDHTDSKFDKNHFLIYGKMTKPSKLSQTSLNYFGCDLLIQEIS